MNYANNTNNKRFFTFFQNNYPFGNGHHADSHKKKPSDTIFATVLSVVLLMSCYLRPYIIQANINIFVTAVNLFNIVDHAGTLGA